MLQVNPTILDVRRYAASCKRKQRRKVIKNGKAKEVLLAELNLGSFHHVQTMTGLVPYNSHGRTTYLIERGINCIGEKTKSGFRIYMTGGRIIITVAELRSLVDNKVIPKPVIARRFELKVGNSLILS